MYFSHKQVSVAAELQKLIDSWIILIIIIIYFFSRVRSSCVCLHQQK